MGKTCDELAIDICRNCNDKSIVLMNAKRLVWSNPYTLCDFAEYVPLSQDKDVMKVLEDGMLRFDDIVHEYEFMFLMVDMGIKTFNLPRFEKRIKESKNPKLMFYSLAYIPGIDFIDMLMSLYKLKNIKYLHKLNHPEYEINTSELVGYKKALKEASNFPYFPVCLEKFGTKNIDKLIPMVINSKDIYLLNELADYLEYLRVYRGESYSLESIENAHMDYAKHEPLHLYEYASSIASANKDKYTNLVIASEMVKYMYYMYEYVVGVNKEKLSYYIKESENEKYIKKLI